MCTTWLTAPGLCLQYFSVLLFYYVSISTKLRLVKKRTDPARTLSGLLAMSASRRFQFTAVMRIVPVARLDFHSIIHTNKRRRNRPVAIVAIVAPHQAFNFAAGLLISTIAYFVWILAVHGGTTFKKAGSERSESKAVGEGRLFM